ncbi:MAG: cation:proton antiporter [Spirochaetales bacterium]|nr:cation:proton antiporter [Spirochaetales bacterium]MBO6049359.1 cation:proton antiporter [Spirochaetales bacterium]MBP5756922.1 cation:proton antiporter [Spirochaetales bacterium]
MSTELLSLAIAMGAGLMMTRLFKVLHLNFPDVTAFLVSGLLVGPYCLGRLGIPGLGFNSFADVEAVEIISTVALGFIAFSIGNEFKLSQLKGTGKQAVVVGIFQAVVAMICVDIVLAIVALFTDPQIFNMSGAITLGAIATATAPAATLMVVKQYKAHGKVTDLLLPVVALDDAVGLVAFAVSFGIAEALISSSVNLVAIIINPLLEIVLSLGLGALMGFILTKIEELFYSNSNRLNMSLAFVFMTIALAQLEFNVGPVKISFSSLLVCMMLGTVFCNLCPRSGDIMIRSDKWTSPLFCCFFVISGADLDLSVFGKPIVVLIGILYVIARSFGKYFGARESCKAVHCDPMVSKYLGYALLPQAGVALGMSVQAEVLGTYEGRLIRSIVLFGVLIYEMFGPMITKWALTKSGDIAEMPASKTTHDRFNTPKDHRRA